MFDDVIRRFGTDRRPGPIKGAPREIDPSVALKCHICRRAHHGALDVCDRKDCPFWEFMA
jgi:hypothetical protein